MIVVHGVYKFAPKRIAFRNDFCLGCKGPRIAVQVRSFYFGHLYWIPLLPLGRWNKWFCSVCLKNPHQIVETRRSFKILLVICLVMMMVPLWYMTPRPDEFTTIWVMRLVFTAAFGGSLWWATRGHRAPPSLRQGLATVAPYEERTCPFCGGHLYDNPRWHCPACGVDRLAL